MLRHTGICRPNGLLFHQKFLDMGHILVKKKILRGGSHFTKIRKKIVKSAIFEAEKPLQKWVSICENFKKNCLISRF